jgi:hypothetical protein
VVQAQDAFKESEGQEDNETATKSQFLWLSTLSKWSDWDENTGNDHIKHFPLLSMSVKSDFLTGVSGKKGLGPTQNRDLSGTQMVP